MAAGRKVSQAASINFTPLRFSQRASLPLNVVFPEPFRPATSTTAGLPLTLISEASLPMKSASSSWTILTIICCGLTAVSTPVPMALVFTFSQNSFATL